MKSSVRSTREALKRDGIQVEGLSKRQNEHLAYLLQCWLSGFIPSLREMAEHFGYNSHTGSMNHLMMLERLGYIKREKNMMLMLTDSAMSLVI